MIPTRQIFAMLVTVGLSAVALVPAAAQTANENLSRRGPGAAYASTAVPALIPYSGTALGIDGKPLTVEIGVTFLVFKDDQGGDPVFTETQTVTPNAEGRYQVQLGATYSSGIPADVFVNGDARWLEVQISGQAPPPRQLLVSVPYAMKAADAATLGGLPASAFVLAGSQNATNAVIPAASLIASPNATSGSASAVTTTGGTSGRLAVFSGASAIATSNLFENTTGVGIGTTTPAATLDVNGTVDLRGIASLFPSANATAATGDNSYPLTLSASAFNSTSQAAVTPNFAWQAEPSGNNTATPSATLNLLSSAGTAAATETGFYFNPDGTVHFAAGQTFPGTGAGTLTAVTAGTGLTGGGASGNITLSVDPTKVVTTVLAGTDLTGGGTGGNITLSLDTTKVPQLNASSNLFAGNLAVGGMLSASGGFTGNLLVPVNKAIPEKGASAYGAHNFPNTAFGLTSSPLDFHLTYGSLNAANSIGEDFLWQAEPTWDVFGQPVGTLNLLESYSGSSSLETGVSFDSKGTISAANLTVSSRVIAPNIVAYVPQGTVATPALTVVADEDGKSRNAAQQLVIQGTSDARHELLIGYVAPPTNSGTPGYSSIQSTFTGVQNTPLSLNPNGGGVGIQTTTITNALTVGQSQGPAIADGWATYSSRRFKTNIRTLPDALTKVEKLRGVSYDLKANGKHEIGVIAEEVGAVVPEIVEWESNGKDARGVDYARLTALLIEATKQQQAEFDEQSARLGKALSLIRDQQFQIHKQAASIRSLAAQVRTANQSVQQVKQQLIAPQAAPSWVALNRSR
jgi:hypothetical protein